MATNIAKILMIYAKMNIHMNIMHIQVIIDYVDNTVNKKPGRVIFTYSEELYNYVGNNVDI